MNIREEITRRIVAALESAPPWRKGWTASGLNINFHSNKPYRGINLVLLGMQGRTDPRWLTYKQARQAGFQVRKGEKSTPIVRMVEVDSRGDDSGPESEVLAEERGRRLVMRLYHVFNAEQIDGMPPLVARTDNIEPSEAVDAIVDGLKATGLKLHHGGPVARYIPSIDRIDIPNKADFESSYAYFATLLHECSHGSGAPHRLNRNFGSPNSPERAREELKAELASSMLAAETGIPEAFGQQHVESHAAYLQSWATLLKSDVNAIFEAAAAAQGICDYLNANALKLKSNPAHCDVSELPSQELAPAMNLKPSTTSRTSFGV